MLASVEISCRKFFAAGGSGFDVMIVSSAGCAEIALRGFFYPNGEEDGCNNNKKASSFANPILLCLPINSVLYIAHLKF